MKKQTFVTGMALVAALPAFALMENATPESQGVSSAAVLQWIDAWVVMGSVEYVGSNMSAAGKTLCSLWLRYGLGLEIFRARHFRAESATDER